MGGGGKPTEVWYVFLTWACIEYNTILVDLGTGGKPTEVWYIFLTWACTEYNTIRADLGGGGESAEIEDMGRRVTIEGVLQLRPTDESDPTH